MINPFPTYTLEEALSMLPDGPYINTRYETVPNCGITKCAKAERETVIALLTEAAQKAAIFQSGEVGMKLGFPFHIEVKNFRDGTSGNLFIEAKRKN